jgi:hypothetical protein
MPIAQPIATDPLNTPDHSALHRIIAADPTGPVKTIQVDSAGVSAIGDPALVNYARFAADGELNLYGTAKITKMVNLGIDGLATGSAAPVVRRLGDFYGYEFSLNDDGYVRPFELPYDIDISQPINFKIHWYINEAYGLSNGEIKWEIKYSPRAIGEAVNAGSATLDTGDINIPGTALHLAENSMIIPAAALAFDDVIGIQVKRIALTGGVDPAAEPVIVGLEITYIANKLGEAT